VPGSVGLFQGDTPKPPGKAFSELSESYRKRIISFNLRNNGLSAAETEQRYDSGTLGSQKEARRGTKGAVSEGHRDKRPIRAIVRDGATTRVVVIQGTTRSERKRIAQHWNYVGAFIDGRRDSDYLEKKMQRFDGKQAGIVGRDKWRLETRVEGFELLAFRHELDFESIYVESGNWAEAA
jgi:hypothetical protein